MYAVIELQLWLAGAIGAVGAVGAILGSSLPANDQQQGEPAAQFHRNHFCRHFCTATVL